MDAQREVDHVGIDADFCGDLPDVIDVSADHYGDPLVRLLDPFQRLLQFLLAVEYGIDARPVELDRVDRQHIPAVVNAVGVRPLDDIALRESPDTAPLVTLRRRVFAMMLTGPDWWINSVRWRTFGALPL